MHNTPDDVIRLKKECASSSELPDLKSAFYGATIEGGWPKPIVLHLDPSPEVSQQSKSAMAHLDGYSPILESKKCKRKLAKRDS